MKVTHCDQPTCRLCQMAAEDGWGDTGHPVSRPWADVAGMLAVVILGAIFFVLVVQL
jgi:hypothetical protein